MMMTNAEIMAALGRSGREYPREAMAAAAARGPELAPELLAELETVADDPEDALDRPAEARIVPLLLLLGQLRETRAMGPLLRLLRGPGEAVDELLAEFLPEGLARVLASVWSGPITPLKELIEDDELDEFHRTTAVDAWVTLVGEGAAPRAEFLEQVRDWLRGGLGRDADFLWYQLAVVVAELHAVELLPDVAAAYKKGWISNEFCEPEVLLAEIRDGTVAARSWCFVTDAVAEGERWFPTLGPEFDDPVGEAEAETDADDQPAADAAGAPAPPSVPQANVPPPPPPEPVRSVKIGRNEPCPCGSGKKHKKCCGA